MRLRYFVFLIFANGLLHAETGGSTPCEFPLKFRDGLLWVEVHAPQSARPLNFLVDSGASVSVLNSSTARQLGLALGPKVRVKGVRATLTGNWPVHLTAKAETVELPDEYLALNLSKLSAACSGLVDGLLGADFFRDRIVQIDYAAQKLRLLEIPPQNETTTMLPMQIRHCGLRLQLSVNGHKPQWVRLDTGCATALQWVTTTVKSESYTTRPAVGLAELSIPQTMVNVSLGGQQVSNVPAGLHRRAIFPGESGLLGNGLLSRFGVVTIDAKAGRLMFGSPPTQ